MKKLIAIILLATVSSTIIASTSITPLRLKATCNGSKNCNACKNCKYCKHCSKNGGTCGVCK
jgi:hypothetical protein